MSRIKNVIKSKGGFTLIELLIVIVIIGILAAIVIPNIADLVGTAEKGQAEAELNTLRTEVTAYRAQEGNYPEPDDVDDLPSWDEIEDNWDSLEYTNDDNGWSIDLTHDFGDGDETKTISDKGITDWEDE